LADVLLVQELGMKVTQVPYRGAGPALVDLLAGQVDLSPISAVVAGPLVRDGKLKAYAILGKNRFAAYLSSKPWSNSATRSSTSIFGTCC
jgi:putative tricarboxylic transport membrane protein